MKYNYTVLLFTFNEESRLEFIIKNFSNKANIVVLDGGSTDNTIEIANKHNVKVVNRSESIKWDEYKSEKEVHDKLNWILNQSENEYVLIAYCSLFVPLELLTIFNKVALENKIDAIKHGYVSYTYDKIVDQSLFHNKGMACHFFKKSAIDFKNSRMHEEWPLKSNCNILYLKDYNNLSLHVFRDYDASRTEIKHNGYSNTEALERFNSGERTSFFKLIAKPVFEFVRGYIFRSGFKSGIQGLLYHSWRAQMAFNIQARIWELQSNLTRNESQDIQNNIRINLLKSIN